MTSPFQHDIHSSLVAGGIKLRRQHWCFLALVLVVLIICLGVLLPNTSTLNNLTKEEQKNLVAQILTEVPLIDGYVPTNQTREIMP